MTTPEHRPEPPPQPCPEPAGDDSLANAANPTSETGPANSRRIPIYRDFILLQLAAIVFLADQFTKYLVQQFIPFGYSWPLWLGREVLQFTHIHNTGSIFGILQGQNTPLIVVSFIGVFVLIMVYYSQPRPTHLLRLSLGLQLGGAFGNLIDRLRCQRNWLLEQLGFSGTETPCIGAVTDFIDVSRWPVFNLADASIVTGLLLLAWILLRANRQDAAANPPAADPAAAATADRLEPADPTDREQSQ